MSPHPAALADPGRLLAAWEAGAGAPQVARGLVLAEVAGAVDDLDAALDLPLAEQTCRLAQVYSQAFGAVVEATLQCAECSSLVEVQLPLSAFDPADGRTTATVALGNGGTAVVRALTGRDLLRAAEAADPAAELLAQTVTDADGRPIAAADMDGPARAAIDAAAEALAGGAALVVRATCPDCDADLTAPVDVASLLWERITAVAPAILAEVAELAAAFGWSERDVLALPAPRRAAYLEMARGGRP